MNILVTGASGFVGRHLMHALEGHDITGTFRNDGSSLAREFPRAVFRRMDILDSDAVSDLVASARPDACFHLAGVASVDTFASHPQESFRINVEGWQNLLEAFRVHTPKARVAFVSSCQVYGPVPNEEMPIREDRVLRPANFYSVSKMACEGLANVYAQSHGSDILILRPFNHIGPGQSPSFVCSSLAKQVARIEAGQGPGEIRMGNTASRRDFTDVRDIARAYVLALQRCEGSLPYNIASEVSVSVQEVLEKLLDLAGLSKEVTIHSKPRGGRDPQTVTGSCQRFRRKTGWRPEISLEKTLKDTLDYWRNKIAGQKETSRASV